MHHRHPDKAQNNHYSQVNILKHSKTAQKSTCPLTTTTFLQLIINPKML